MHERIIQTARQKVLFTRHAIEQMNKPERLINEKEVMTIVMEGTIIEEYPQDPRGSSCLVSGVVQGRPLHVVCAPKQDYLAVVTAYVPNLEEWSPGFKKRRR